MITPIPGFSEPFSSISHLSGAVISFIATFFLIFRGRGNNGRVIGLVIYSFTLVFLLSMSGVYHLLQKGFTANYVLQILDHVGIYCLIAGTFTPIHLILFRGLHRWLILMIIWTLAITGLTLTAIYLHEIPEWLSLSFFLGLGWIGLFSMYNIYKIHSKKLVKYITFGGLAYTIGAVIEFINPPHLINNVIGPHEIFHVFVLIGAFYHWKLVYKISKFPISSKIIIMIREYPNNKFTAEATSEHAYFESDSQEDVKKQVMTWIENKFHNDMQPKLVNFKYFKEENIYL